MLCTATLLRLAVVRLSLTVSMTWKGRLTRDTSLSVPSSSYWPDQLGPGRCRSSACMSVFSVVLFSIHGDGEPAVVESECACLAGRVLDADDPSIARAAFSTT